MYQFLWTLDPGPWTPSMVFTFSALVSWAFPE